jgi:hypothetical protein
MVSVEQSVEWELARGNRSTRRKPAPMPLCSPQLPYDLTWDRTRWAAVGSRRLTSWAMARPGIRGYSEVTILHNISIDVSPSQCFITCTTCIRKRKWAWLLSCLLRIAYECKQTAMNTETGSFAKISSCELWRRVAWFRRDLLLPPSQYRSEGFEKE